ncbi:MAG: protein phosphatase 2C domain-containing protein [Pseudolysinimonas sp.]
MTGFPLSTATGALQLRVGSVSHVGMVRTVNEDAVLAEPPVFAVADGMGGHAFGDRASAAAILALHEEFDPEQATDSSQVFAAIRRANAAVRDLTAWAGSERVMAGTTLTGVALVVESPGALPQWMVFNLGDSRVYRWLDRPGAGALERVSVDHSLVQELLDAGEIDEAGARVHPERNVVTRALGAADEVSAEAWLLPASEQQAFLICSDGLTKELDDSRIAELLVALDPSESPDAAVDRLLAAALSAGGSDNVSIVLLRAEYQPAQPAAQPSTGDGVAQTFIDEQTHERVSWADFASGLSPELDDTRPRR